ncbi:aminoglycoside phosphotransferase family protein [Pontibacillus sp. HMF3514]|uniref:aminoglycoside phosphotransferase family protein n=1 Tax=Pontibacillus sp. HMF3514 TaxID=2692425 RepID=UPI00131FFC59|nr:aminoglycoside phosphotransferase family protein [Pontibacillus sp. HMF3514]QHE53123.1 phosphotransferase [Pontibacillus sp. HMF3514]
MRSIQQKGEGRSGFPFSFVQLKGDLHIEQTYQIKPHVYKVRGNDQTYILKQYSSKLVVQQQWDFFEQTENPDIVRFVPFPNGERFICGDQGDVYTLAPCMNGWPLSYNKEKDRIASHDLLSQFQQSSLGIKLDSMIPKLPIYMKWKKRLHTFSAFLGIFEAFGQRELFDAITQKSYAILSEVEQLDWRMIEEDAVQKGSWIHGDVASHNFIRDGAQVRLIDFDLLGQSPPVYDWIQLAQRWMEHVEAEQLLRFKGFQQCSLDPLWLYGVQYPSDVMREWISFMRTQPSQEEIYYFLTKMAGEWTRRESFVEQLNTMLT